MCSFPRGSVTSFGSYKPALGIDEQAPPSAVGRFRHLERNALVIGVDDEPERIFGIRKQHGDAQVDDVGPIVWAHFHTIRPKPRDVV